MRLNKEQNNLLFNYLEEEKKEKETKNLQRNFSTLFPFALKALKPEMNSLKSTSPPPSSSNIAIILDAKGLFAICGIERNSSRSMEPEPSLSSFINLL